MTNITDTLMSLFFVFLEFFLAPLGSILEMPLESFWRTVLGALV